MSKRRVVVTGLGWVTSLGLDVDEEKVARIANDIPPTEIEGDDDAEILVLGWGSTWAAIDAAVQRSRRFGKKVAKTHLGHLNPLPPDLGEVLGRYKKVIVPELNYQGQWSGLLRQEGVKAVSITQYTGLPFRPGDLVVEIKKKIESVQKAGVTA